MITIIDESRYAELNSKLDTVIAMLTDKIAMQQSNPSWLTATQVLQKLNVCNRSLQNYRDQGLIGFSKFGRKILYKNQDVELLLESSYSKPFLQKKKKESYLSPLKTMTNVKTY